MIGDDLKIASPGRFRLNEPAVVADVIDDETIIMNLEKGDYYSLNPSGGELWRLLLSGLHREELLAVIAQRHGITPSRLEIDRFIDRLVEFRLIVATEHANDPVSAGKHPAPAPWRTPEISVYSDMKDLLAMDPPLPLVKPTRN